MTASGNPTSKPHAARGAKANAKSKRKPATRKKPARKKKPVRRRNTDLGPEYNVGIEIPYSVQVVYQRYWTGQGDPLYAVLSRRGLSTDWVTVQASEEEMGRLSDVTIEILENSEDEGERATAEAFEEQLEDADRPDIDDLVEIARKFPGVEGAKVANREDPTIHAFLEESTAHLYQYDDGSWWWQRGAGSFQEDEDIDGYSFLVALRNAVKSETDEYEDNPRKKKKKSSKLKKRAKKAGKKVKKFAKTEAGYATGGALVGSVLLGPLGLLAGGAGGAALHDNPGGDLGDIFEVQVEFFSDAKLKENFKEVSEGLSESKDPIRDFGTEGYPMYQRMLVALKKEMVSRGFLQLNPGRKKKSRKKNPSAADHERVGLDALANSEKFHKRYESYGRVNDLLDTYQWLVIAHEELKYSGKSEKRIQARDGLEEIRRQLERIIK